VNPTKMAGSIQMVFLACVKNCALDEDLDPPWKRELLEGGFSAHCKGLGLPFDQCAAIQRSFNHQQCTCHMKCLQARRCPYGVQMRLLPIYGVRSPRTPILGARVGVFGQNTYNIITFILSKLLHRFQANFAQQ